MLCLGRKLLDAPGHSAVSNPGTRLSHQDFQEHENFSDPEDVESVEESSQTKKKRKGVRHALFERRIYFLVHEGTLDEANKWLK